MEAIRVGIFANDGADGQIIEAQLGAENFPHADIADVEDLQREIAGYGAVLVAEVDSLRELSTRLGEDIAGISLIY